MSGGQNIVSAVTLHHYYFSDEDRRASIHDFVNASVLDSLKDELYKGTLIAHTYAPSLPVWLSETSSVTGNALPGVTDGFVAGFMWLDKLGLCALYGLQAVVRQTFYHGTYPLVADDYTPNPDYYLTLLFKQLVQGPVFKVTGASENVRVYMQCANRESYPAGSLVVYALNVQKKAAVLNLTQFAEKSLDVFLLTPGDEQGLKSKYVALNGKKLEMVDEELPPLLPQTHSGPVTMAPYSFAYIVIPDANVKSCY
ncbi:heparanase-like [Pomacea canaliculata]|nr:heparanase-like [Pomacea canaliculata]XP_025080665.1 heparanase-like [Pomacea canaliculata]